LTGLDLLAAAGLLMLFVTWVAYPLAVAALGSLRRPLPRGWPGELPAVSVLIATREHAAAVRARVENCLASEYDPARLEVVVALDRGAGATAADLADLDGVKLVDAEAPGGKACALNAGMRAASGEVVVFADTYQRFEPDSVRRLVDALGDPRLGAVSGLLEIPAGRAALARTYWRYERWLRLREARLHSTVGATGSIYAMRAGLWTPLPPGVLLDDVFAPMRIVMRGMRVGMAADARAIELRETAPAGEYRRKVRTLTGVLQVCAWLPGVLVPWKNPVWVQFVVHKLFRMITPLSLLPVVLWVAWQAAGSALDMPPLQLAALMVVIGAAFWWVLGSSHRRARQVRDVLVEGTLLQAAIVMAGVNGLRGRWKVWNG
jgi:poly-beta-1,6-N-acetyl-D-glucosamine synthase